MKTAIITGTFDPVTIGHEDIIRRAARLFPNVVIAVSSNTEKRCMFPDDIRVAALRECLKDLDNVKVELCTGLISEFCAKFAEPVIVRGARNGSDFDYERQLYIINKGMGVPESIVLPASGGIDHISSTYARDMIKYGKSLCGIVPEQAREIIEKQVGE